MERLGKHFAPRKIDYANTLLKKVAYTITNDNPATIKTNMRKAAANHPDNYNHYKPEMSANEASKYIVEQ